MRSYLASFSSGDPELVAAHVSDNFVNEHTAALGTGCIGKAAYRSRLPGFLSDMAELAYGVEDLVVGGLADGAVTVAAFYTMTASWQGDVPISVQGVQRLVVRDGLIDHRTDYWDSANFLLQASADAAKALAPFGIHR